MLAKVRMGRTQIIYNHLLKNVETSMCIACQEQYRVKHIGVNCKDLKLTGKQYYQLNNLKSSSRKPIYPK